VHQYADYEAQAESGRQYKLQHKQRNGRRPASFELRLLPVVDCLSVTDSSLHRPGSGYHRDMSDVAAAAGDDDAVCRICRGGAEADLPLKQPCKCLGSIGHVHEQCLFDWLNSRRGREQCEVCHTKYHFNKVYSTALPARLPVWVLIKRICLAAAWVVATMARAVFVGFCWIGFLPYCTVWVFRFLIYNGHNLSSSLSAILTGDFARYGTAAMSETSNATLAGVNATDLAVTNATLTAERHMQKLSELVRYVCALSSVRC
jgi:hypothetical protein